MAKRKANIGIREYIRALRLPFITASILPFILGSCISRKYFHFFPFILGLLCAGFTHAPESRACKGVDEWLPVRGFAPERNPESKEATAVRPWSFTLFLVF